MASVWVDPAELRVGDVLELERDGQRLEVTVWRLEPAGSAGRRYGAGPGVAAWIRPGGYGVTLDRDTAAARGYRGRLERPHYAVDTPDGAVCCEVCGLLADERGIVAGECPGAPLVEVEP